MNPITNFVFDAQEGDARPVRVVMIDGEPWFLAADVCAVLGHKNTSMALERIDDDEKAKFNLGLQGSEANIVNESGLYSLILGSRKPEAKAFKKWVTAQVLPSIRKTGAYVDPSAALPPGEPPHRFLSHGADHMVAADRTFRSLVRSGRAAGLRMGAAIARANAITVARTGINILEAMEVEPEEVSLVAGRGRMATGEIRGFWAALEAGFMGLPGPLPMLSTQAYELYRRWAREGRARPISMAEFIYLVRSLGLAETIRQRWRNDMGRTQQSTFLVPAGVKEFDPTAAASYMETIIPVAG